MKSTKTQYNIQNMFYKKLNLIPTVLIFLLILVGCDNEDAFLGVDKPIAVSFDESSSSVEVENGTTFDVVVSSLTPPASDLVVNLIVDSAPDLTLFDMVPSVTIPAGELSGSSVLSFSYDLLDFGDTKTLELSIDSSTLTGDAILNEEREKTTIDFVKKCTLNDVTVSITTDTYPEETSYRVFDVTTNPSGDLVYDSGSFAGQSETTVSTKHCLGTGNYAIVVYDSWGDGIVGGGFTVSVNGTEVVPATAVTGSTAVAYFDIN